MNVRLVRSACLIAASVLGSPSAKPLPVAPPVPDSDAARAYRLYASGRFAQAATLYEQAYRRGMQEGNRRQAVRYLNNLAGCRFAGFQYAGAMETYLEARRLAVAASDYETQGAVAINIASLYLQMGNLESAATAATQGLAAVHRHRLPGAAMAQLFTLMGRIRFLQRRYGEGAAAYREAIGEALTSGDMPQLARSWDSFGYSCLRQGRLHEAETSLIESYRLRLLFHRKDLHLSYTNLALLRLAQHDLRSAAVLSQRAVELASQNIGGAPLWHVIHTRGLVREAQGDTRGAVSAFGRAMEEVRRWRIGVLPADALRATADEALNSVYTSYVRAGARLYFESGARQWAVKTFEVMEQSRAVSLRESAGSSIRLPPEYGEALARMRTAEAASNRGHSPLAREAARRARLQLVELETRAGLESAGRRSHLLNHASLNEIRQSLAPGQSLISYLVAEPQSYCWIVTRRGLSLHRLAGRGRLTELVDASAAALRSGRAGLPEAARLARELFLQNEPELGSSTRWLIELDDVLLRVPVAALPDPTTGARFIVERHAVQILPSVLLRADPAADPPARLFAGLGDPVYNFADPRCARPAAAVWAPGFLFWPAGSFRLPAPVPQLPRLAASEQEVQHSAEAWSSNPADRVLLFGNRATNEALAGALNRRPSVIHLATHVLRSTLLPDEEMIALGLGNGHTAQFLDSAAIRRLQVPGALVVLSGCSTGAGEILRGAGLMGLTRAWLLAGARGVIASHWPTPDDSGEFFVSFYRHLRAAPGDFASALRHAQLEMLRSGSWRSQPSYWAAYFDYGIL